MDHIELGGLDGAAVATVVEAVAVVPPEDLDKIYRRAGGHPVFTRELALVWAQGEPTIIPSAVRDAIELRARRLAEPTRRSLEVAALSGNEFHVGVVATALGATTADVEAACRVAINARVLTGTPEVPRFAHDLYREAIAASVDSGVTPGFALSHQRRPRSTPPARRSGQSGRRSPALYRGSGHRWPSSRGALA